MSAGSEGAAELQEHRRGAGGNIRDQWCGYDGCQGQSAPLYRLCHQIPRPSLGCKHAGSLLLAGRYMYPSSHAPHNDPNPSKQLSTGCWSTSHGLGAFSDLGCHWLLWIVPSALICPSCDPVPLPSESPTGLCSTTRCALYPSSKDSVSAPRMEAAVCAACTLQGTVHLPRAWPGGQGVLARGKI